MHRMYRFGIAGLTLALAAGAAADTITVALDGTGDYMDIQDAIDAAVDGDDVLVMPGTYWGVDLGWVFDTMGKLITVHSEQGPEETIIDGQGFHRGFVCRGGETADTVIDGFTFSGCFSYPVDIDGNGTLEWWDQCGGAAAIIYGDVTISNCHFINNTADGNGGAIGLLAYSAVTLDNCVFEDNSATWDGGAIFTTTWSPLTMTNCAVRNNTASGNGGAVKGGGSGAMSYTSCTVQGNTAGNEGGGLFLGSCPTSLSFTTVCGNSGEQIASGDWDDVIGNIVTDVCPSLGACCTTECVAQASEADCLRFAGTWYGEGSTCADIVCEGGGGSDCLGDVDGNNVVDVNDLLTILSVYGDVCP